MKTINVKELKNISINELIEIIENNKLVFELPEKNYTLELNNLPINNLPIKFYMYIYPNYHNKKFFTDLKMVNNLNEVESYFYERFNDIIVRHGVYNTFPITKTIENLAIIVKHLIDIYHKNFIPTKKDLLLQMI